MEVRPRDNIFLQASAAPAVVIHNAEFRACSEGVAPWQHTSSSRRCSYSHRPKPVCRASGGQHPLWMDCTRRRMLQISQQLVVGAACVGFPNFSLAAEEKVKSYTNIDDARAAGEKLRDIQEAEEGPVLVSSSGVKYRELERGLGNAISPGDVVSVYYTISRLNGYYLDSMGYGKEGKNDVGETLDFQYGSGMVPEAVEGGMEGMQVGAKRRILVTPERGWVRPDLLPLPTSFFAERRLSNRRTTQALLIEVELVKAKPIID